MAETLILDQVISLVRTFLKTARFAPTGYGFQEEEISHKSGFRFRRRGLIQVNENGYIIKGLNNLKNNYKLQRRICTQKFQDTTERFQHL